jgi:hypothetical protein
MFLLNGRRLDAWNWKAELSRAMNSLLFLLILFDAVARLYCWSSKHFDLVRRFCTTFNFLLSILQTPDKIVCLNFFFTDLFVGISLNEKVILTKIVASLCFLSLLCLIICCPSRSFCRGITLSFERIHKGSLKEIVRNYDIWWVNLLFFGLLLNWTLTLQVNYKYFLILVSLSFFSFQLVPLHLFLL